MIFKQHKCITLYRGGGTSFYNIYLIQFYVSYIVVSLVCRYIGLCLVYHSTNIPENFKETNINF